MYNSLYFDQLIRQTEVVELVNSYFMPGTFTLPRIAVIGSLSLI
jgi:hypothetical protein